MFNIDVIDGATSTRVTHQPGNNLLVTLRAAGISIRTGCQLIGACALCSVYVRKGHDGPITITEKLQLGHRLSQGMRLACQVIPEGDLVIELISETNNMVYDTESTAMRSEYLPDCSLDPVNETGYGIAVDVGTTNVNMSLFQRKNGELLAYRCFSNPQREYGTDVIARMLKAAEDPAITDALQYRLFEKVQTNLQNMIEIANIGLNDITEMGIVGNTAMLALFNRSSCHELLDPKFWEKSVIIPDKDITGIKDFFGFHQQTSIKIIDPLAVFVGSDLLAGTTAIRLLDKEPGTLFVDFGTNTEIALWDGKKVWVTAAAGGPAFEGGGMSYGCAAISGAIYQVHRTTDEDGLLSVLSIDGEEIKGICGSGYVGIIAALLEMNSLDKIGRLPGKRLEDQEITIIEEPLIKITKQDIDTFQRAKAAVAAGIRVLSQRAEISPSQIKGIYVAGNFGRYLDILSAQQIGLLPDIDRSRIYLCENTALRGCSDILLYQEAREILAQTRDKANYINLAFDAEFESIFMESLYLRPY